jgi:hypothetical protein
MKVGNLVRWTPTLISAVARAEKDNHGVVTDLNAVLKKVKVHWAKKPNVFAENNVWVYLRNVTLIAEGIEIAEI